MTTKTKPAKKTKAATVAGTNDTLALKDLREVVAKFIAREYPAAKFVSLLIDYTDMGSSDEELKLLGDYGNSKPWRRPASKDPVEEMATRVRAVTDLCKTHWLSSRQDIEKLIHDLRPLSAADLRAVAAGAGLSWEETTKVSLMGRFKQWFNLDRLIKVHEEWAAEREERKKGEKVV